MKTIILFGGGDGGGLMTTAQGVHSIPPFDAAIRHSLKSAAAMVNAAAAAAKVSDRQKMAKLAMSLCNLAIEQVEQQVGPLDPDRALIYQDAGGGFMCGSTGKPPVAIPWPPRSMPSVTDLLTAGAIESDLLRLVEKVWLSKVPLNDLFEKPSEIAQQLGVPLSDKSARALELLATSRLDSIKNDTDREIARFFHKVIEDGRYLATWFDHPYEVSRELNVELSDAALDKLLAGDLAGALAERGRQGAPDDDLGTTTVYVFVAVGVAVGVVGVVVGGAAAAAAAGAMIEIDDVVKDRSGVRKI